MIEDLGWLKRKDLGNGRSALLDAFGNQVAEVNSNVLDERGMKNNESRRFRLES